MNKEVKRIEIIILGISENSEAAEIAEALQSVPASI